MCLAKVTEVLRPMDQAERYAWKVFWLLDDGYAQLYFTTDGEYQYILTPKVPTGKWLKARVTKLDWPTYYSGFHVFARRRDALLWAAGSQVVVRVRVRGVQTLGLQADKKVLVCRELWVPKFRKPKDPGKEAPNGH